MPELLNQLPEDVNPQSGMGIMLKEMGMEVEPKEEVKKEDDPPPAVPEPLEIIAKQVETFEEEPKKVFSEFIDTHKKLVVSKTELENQLTTLKTEVDKYKELEKTSFNSNEKVKTFLEGLSKDFVGTIKTYEKELNLPNVDLIVAQLTANTNDIPSRVKQFQEQVLKSKIEEKFKLASGTFVYDADDAENPETPSYEWRKQTRVYEERLENELKEAQKIEQENQKLIENQLAQDKAFLAKEYFADDSKKVDEALAELNLAPRLIKDGKLGRERHPFGIRNLFLGFHFDTLAKGLVDKAVNDLTEQYKAQGLVLAPPPPSKVGEGSKVKGGNEEGKDNGKFKSPAEQSILQFTR